MAPVLPSEQFEELACVVGLLGGHHCQSLLVKWIVEADGEVAVALPEEALHAFLCADGRDGDALGAPCPAVRRGEQFGGLQHGVEVVHRFALSHEDDVGELLAARYGIDLIKDVGDREVAAEALPACHAEAASHAASRLTADAERGSVAVRDEDALHLLPALRREEVLSRSINALLDVAWLDAAYLVALGQGRPSLERQVSHLVDAPNLLAVNPLHDLLRCKGWQPYLCSDAFHLVESHAKQLLLFHFVPFEPQRYIIKYKKKALKGKKLSFFTSFV